jgi:hypothetical protein
MNRRSFIESFADVWRSCGGSCTVRRSLRLSRQNKEKTKRKMPLNKVIKSDENGNEY